MCYRNPLKSYTTSNVVALVEISTDHRVWPSTCMCMVMSAVPIETFSTSDEVGELQAGKLNNSLLIVATCFSPATVTKDFMHLLHHALTVHLPTLTIFVEDLNIDIKNKTFLPLMYENIMLLFIATRPTYVMTLQNPCIDFVIENQALVQKVKHTCTHFSDHKASFITIAENE